MKRCFRKFFLIFIMLFFVCSVFAKGNKDSFRARTFTNTIGNGKFILRGDMGTFQLFTVKAGGIEVPVFSGTDNFTSSYFSLFIDKVEYKLNSSNGIKTGAMLTNDGGALSYTIAKTAKVIVDFAFIKSPSSKVENIIKVTATVTNTSNRKSSVALKGVFDTVLGEKTSAHFSTANIEKINEETQFHDMRTSLFILSKNETDAIQFMLCGADVTNPETVTLGNKDIISLPLWSPVFVSSRSFDNVMSYNNSAIAINWPKITLEANEESKYIFYIAISSDGNIPSGEEYMSFIDPLYYKLKSSTGVLPEKTSIPEWKLNYEYIQMLINKINMLDETDETINSEEISSLNKEIDEILELLRQK